MKSIIPYHKVRFLTEKNESLIFSMMNFSNKLCLTGGNVLYMTCILNRTPGDIDFGLTEPLTENELAHIMDFFKLKVRDEMINFSSAYDANGNAIYLNGMPLRNKLIPSPADLLKKEMILLEEIVGEDEVKLATKIDIFNKDYVKIKDLIPIQYNIEKGGFKIIKACHPSIAISYKAKYAFDPRVKYDTQKKHQNDLKDIHLNMEKYFDVFEKKLKWEEELGIEY